MVVVGLPLSLDGTHGPAAKAATTEADRLASVVGVPVEMYDERFTTVTAERGMLEAGLDAPRPPQGGRQGRRRRDAAGVARPSAGTWPPWTGTPDRPMPREDHRTRSAAPRGAGRPRRAPGARLADRPVGRHRSDGHGRAPAPADASAQVDRVHGDGARHRHGHDRRCGRLVVPRQDESRPVLPATCRASPSPRPTMSIRSPSASTTRA